MIITQHAQHEAHTRYKRPRWEYDIKRGSLYYLEPLIKEAKPLYLCPLAKNCLVFPALVVTWICFRSHSPATPVRVVVAVSSSVQGQTHHQRQGQELPPKKDTTHIQKQGHNSSPKKAWLITKQQWYDLSQTDMILHIIYHHEKEVQVILNK